MKTKQEVINTIKNNYSKYSFFKKIFGWKTFILEIISLILDINTDNINNYQNPNPNQILGDERLKWELIRKSEELELIKIEIDKEKSQKTIYKTLLVEKDEALRIKDSRANKNIEELNNYIEKLKENIKIKEESLKEAKLKLDIEKKSVTEKETLLSTSNKNIERYAKEIHEIFNNSTGKKGKIAEMALESFISEVYKDNDNMWTKNLMVGRGIVEFAIKVDQTKDQWVPVDSKAIIPDGKDENDNWIINDKYISKIDRAATEITKYLNKTNTTSFGILVLPNDEFANEIYLNYAPNLEKISNKTNVYISSPNSFTMFLNTIKNINSKLKEISDQKETLEILNLAKKQINQFYNAAEEGLKKINIAFEKHMPNLKNNLEKIDSKVNYQEETLDNLIKG